ncbi:four helix bundle suffix domain-containing protein [Pelotalea chapellei]|uniref:Four helix bundle suffix domain-containing protein n=1 Tax=Pelotalea chapellei TaxID=44671 RepID=A0ABS5UAP9_9BACT|nr:four helix bundle suffix domain-containing protein [Pelotalea chapellei]MBT1072747.1 four helix bundle suffix domain-containing protein [Pelotalea chapellei]
MNESGTYKKLRPSGGYRDLRSFQASTIVYDATVSFCERFIDKRSRLVDQMVQAARSGRQNIAEGSRAAATSSQTELRLVNVARASLDELLLDYEDFLRQRGKRQWTKDDPEAKEVRGVGKKLHHRSDRTDRADPTDHEAYAAWLQHSDPAIVANAMICLIHQTNYLLDQQISVLERSFVNEGGYSEQLAAARLQKRKSLHPTDRSDPTDEKRKFPPCPKCGKPMVVRTARQGKNAGSQFLGCSSYPQCRGIAAV